MSNLRAVAVATTIALTASTLPAQAQDRALSFSLTGGAQVAPKYFGSDDYRVGPSVSFALRGLRFGGFELGDPDGPILFAPGTGVRGAFRYIAKREGRNELAGLDDVEAALEVGIGVHHTTDFWQVYADLRYGVVGHKAIAGKVGANLIYRGESGMVLHAGPRAEFGSARFMQTYFGVTGAEAARSGTLARYMPTRGGVYSVGLEAGAYQPLSADWGLTGTVRYDRLRGDAARSSIVQQGSRNQISAQIGLTRHFNLRF